ncbi:MAG: Ferritin-like domain [Solirubrobacterales bacterium]|jgi:bacterioferritin (cytochrome b1)|nr:Ferritin-like domain [Solirubrobacterales bacterium]
MSEQEERLDADRAVELLNKALMDQYRSALQYSLVASSLVGIQGVGLGSHLKAFGDEELNAVRLLVEKIASLGGEPTVEVAPLRFQGEPAEALGWLAECEQQLVDSLQEAIEPTGREGRSEALEHMLEHLIMRKQHQIDFLQRALAG